MAGNSFAKEIKGMSKTFYLTVTPFFQKCNSLPQKHCSAVPKHRKQKSVRWCFLFVLHISACHGSGAKTGPGANILFIIFTHNFCSVAFVFLRYVQYSSSQGCGILARSYKSCPLFFEKEPLKEFLSKPAWFTIRTLLSCQT